MPEKQLVPFWRFSITAISPASHSLATDHWPLATDHWPLATVLEPLATILPPRAPRPAPRAAGRELGLFSCSIPPSSVLSHHVPMVNTTSNWLCFGAFLSPPVPSLRIHWPLTTDYWPVFSCHWPLFSRHSPLPPKTLPRWLLPATDRRIAKDRMGPIWPSGPSILLCTETGDSCGESNPFPPTRRRPTVDHSLVAGGAQRQWLQACLPDGHQPQCLFSRCSP
jgi:hypothetical protein